MFKIRQVIIYKNYFEDFFLAQKSKVQDKIMWTIKLIESHEQIAANYITHYGDKGTI